MVRQTPTGIARTGTSYRYIYKGAIAHTYRIEHVPTNPNTFVTVKVDGILAGIITHEISTIDVNGKKIEVKSYTSRIGKCRYWKLD